jgi:hypothetical protein
LILVKNEIPDYKKILTPDAFKLYLKLKDWRKAVSNETKLIK